jgi:hypothetical protein
MRFRLGTPIALELTRCGRFEVSAGRKRAMSNVFWLTDEQFTSIEGAIPMNRPEVKPQTTLAAPAGAARVVLDSRRVLPAAPRRNLAWTTGKPGPGMAGAAI